MFLNFRSFHLYEHYFYLIFKHYSTLLYLFIKKKKNTNAIYITLLNIITLKKKKALLHAQSVCDESSIYIYIYFREFQPMTSTPDDSFFSSD